MTKAVKITLIVVGCCILGFVLLVATCVGGFMALTKGPREAGHQLVQLCGAHKLHEAYEATAPAYRAKTDEAAFTAAVKETGLDRAVSASWNQINVVNNLGRVAGTIQLADGHTRELEVRIVKDGDRWVVTGFGDRQFGDREEE
jgi:hypothetical protein